MPTANCDGGGYLVEPFVLSQASPTGGAHALISPYYGSGSGVTCTSAIEPLPTLTAKNRCGLVVPVTHYQGGNGSRSVDDPIPTVTTAKGGEFAVVMPVTHAGGHDRVQGVDESIPTVTGANRGEQAIAQGVVTPAFDGAQYDILFRMLEPHELAAAMGFNTDDQSYEFAGTKTEQIKQIGNAVSVRMMKAEVKAIMADAAPKNREVSLPANLSEAAE